jgi:hypothetical protein
MADPPVRLHVLLFENLPGIWVARGLEHDIAVEALSVRDACESLLQFVRAHIAFDKRHRLEPLASFPTAPSSCWYAFAKASPLDSTVFEQTACGDRDAEIIVSVSRERPAPVLGEQRFLQDGYNMGSKRRRIPDS